MRLADWSPLGGSIALWAAEHLPECVKGVTVLTQVVVFISRKPLSSFATLVSNYCPSSLALPAAFD